jgi:hypothetical protein
MLAALAAVCSADVLGQTAASPPPSAPPIGELKSLGQERYQVGRIVIDKRARSFTVPGRVHALGKPLEYLATTPGGRKSYEALLELDASGTEVNLACILIGLERDPAVPAWKPLGQTGQTGQRVALSLAWTEGGQPRRLSAAQALLNADAAAKADGVEWAYTGSFTSLDGSQLAADVTGTLISFVKKDPTGVIEAVSDVSLGPYGSVRGSTMLPPEGSAIELVVQAATLKK